jgi:predicted SAM-dependent methyltransferase
MILENARGISMTIKVNLGAGLQAYEWPGYISVDKIPSEGIDIVWDCEMGLPRHAEQWSGPENPYVSTISPVGIALATKEPEKTFADNTVDEFLCKHFLEHLSNDGFMRLMDEMHDALKPDGVLHIMVPNCEHPRAAYGDPTHKMRFHVTTFDYFTHETLAAFPYTDKEWEIVEGPEIRGTPPDDLWEIYVAMRPIK